MKIVDRIKMLKAKMLERNIDAYIIPSSDPHMSEYVAPHWKGRQWISGFTGSAGTLVITHGKSGLWTDGRYHIQAEQELEGSGIDLFKMGLDGVPELLQWLTKTLDKGSCVGVDGKLFSVSAVKEMEKEFSNKEISINMEYDLLDGLWKDRPAIPQTPIFLYDVVYSGKSAKEKIEIVRGQMAKKGANNYILSSLDDIAWLFNIRGDDVAYNPVTIAYALISQKETFLFIDNEKVQNSMRHGLKEDGVTIEGYERIKNYLSSLDNRDTILLDPERTNSWIWDAINCESKKVEDRNITTNLKAIKNRVEIENLKEAHIRDGVAMVKFLYWLTANVSKGGISEISAAHKLEEYRSLGDNFIGLSFPTIAGYKDHAAMMHYSATEDSDYTLEAEGMLLVDSGGQYLDGTTDITRTIILGPVTDQQRLDYTLTLKGHISLAKARFLKGATGSNLDVLARQHLWKEGIDYKCGTGHGVGHFLNVHEGPHGISQKASKVKLEKGMIVTNEPGVYRQGEYGIRIENELLVVEDITTEFGEFLKFQPVTYCPIDLEAVDVDLLNHEEKEYINDYHKMVYEKLHPLVNKEEKEWLEFKTRII